MPLPQAAKRIGDTRQAGLLRLFLLDGFEVRSGREVVALPLSVQRLVSILAFHSRSVRRIYVGGILWPDFSEDRAAANLRTTLWRLHSVDVPLVETPTDRLQLSPRVVVDVTEITERVRELILGTAEATGEDVRRIAAVGDLLPDWYDDWILVERERFRQLRLHALEILCARFAATGSYAFAVEAGLAAVAGEPLRESAHRCLIQAHLAEGNLAEAIGQYAAYRDLMRAELDIPPSPGMKQLIRGALESSRCSAADAAV